MYLLPYTHDRVVEVLDTMMRLQRVRNLDLRLQSVLEMAYFSVKPPEKMNREKEVSLLSIYVHISYVFCFICYSYFGNMVNGNSIVFMVCIR